MNYIYLSAVFILVIYRVEGETRLDPRGNNVCKLVTSYTALTSTKTSYNIKTPYKTCCKRIVFCVKRCTKYRTKKIYYQKTRITAKLNTTYRCCKGHERAHPSHTQCLKPICIKGCDVGSCVAPNICQMTYDSRLGFKESVKLPERCGGHIEKASGKIALHGNTTHPIYRTRLCRWTIRIQNGSKATFQFNSFHFHNGTSCAESVITVRQENERIFFFCSIKAPNSQNKLVLGAGVWTIEAVQNNWKERDGFEMTFESKNKNGI